MSVNAVMALTFLPGVKTWNTGVSRRNLEVFDPQAWQSRLRRDTCRYIFDENFVKLYPWLALENTLEHENV